MMREEILKDYKVCEEGAPMTTTKRDTHDAGPDLLCRYCDRLMGEILALPSASQEAEEKRVALKAHNREARYGR